MKTSPLLVVLALGAALWTLPAPSQAADTTCRSSLGQVTVDKVIVPSGADCVLRGTRVKGDVALAKTASLVAYGARIEGNIQSEPTAFVYLLSSTYVKGNVQLLPQSEFGAFVASIDGSIDCRGCELSSVNQLAVRGEVRCDGCHAGNVVATSIGSDLVVKDATLGSYLLGNYVAGNLDIVDSAAGEEMFTLEHNTIGGNLKVEKNDGTMLIQANRLGGDVQLAENSTEELRISFNQIGGDLQLHKTRGPSVLLKNTINRNFQCSDNAPAPHSVDNTARQTDGQCAAR